MARPFEPANEMGLILLALFWLNAIDVKGKGSVGHVDVAVIVGLKYRGITLKELSTIFTRIPHEVFPIDTHFHPLCCTSDFMILVFVIVYHSRMTIRVFI